MDGWTMRGLGMDGGSENRWIDGRVDGRQRGWMYGRLDVWMMRGQMDRRAGGYMGGWIIFIEKQFETNTGL